MRKYELIEIDGVVRKGKTTPELVDTLLHLRWWGKTAYFGSNSLNLFL